MEKKEGETTGAPEAYEAFTLPEGMAMDETHMGQFQTWAKANNLTQEAAQQAVDLVAATQQAQAEQFQTSIRQQIDQWHADSKVDRELAGPAGTDFDKNLAIAKQSLDQFGTPAFKTLLKQSGLGNHPEILRFMYRAGQAISQDTFVQGTPVSGRKSDAEVFYGKNGKTN